MTHQLTVIAREERPIPSRHCEGGTTEAICLERLLRYARNDANGMTMNDSEANDNE
jgi:hypothetical protein